MVDMEVGTANGEDKVIPICLLQLDLLSCFFFFKIYLHL